MDPIAVNSSNTLVAGGKVAEDDIPRDGTGSFHPRERAQLNQLENWLTRRQECSSSTLGCRLFRTH